METDLESRPVIASIGFSVTAYKKRIEVVKLKGASDRFLKKTDCAVNKTFRTVFASSVTKVAAWRR